MTLILLVCQSKTSVYGPTAEGGMQVSGVEVYRIEKGVARPASATWLHSAKVRRLVYLQVAFYLMPLF